MEQREPDGCRGSEILDKGYVVLPEFTAVIRPAGWSKEGTCSGEYTAPGVETARPGFESGVLPHSRQTSCQTLSLFLQSAAGAGERVSLASFLGKQRSGM